MTDRRAFIQGSASLLALSALPLPAAPLELRLPSSAGRRQPLVVLVDRDLDASTAAEVAATGYPVFGFRNDVARVWMNEIEPRLRAGPLGMAGYTSAATLFCLELLARDYGARAVVRIRQSSGVAPELRSLLMTRSAAAPLEPLVPPTAPEVYAWLVATSPTHRAPLAPATHFTRRS